MSLRSQKIVQLFVVNRQVIFVIVVLLAPVLILHLMTTASLRSMQHNPDYAVSRDYPSLNLAYMQTSTEEQVTKADAMTAAQYEMLRQTNPQFPETLDEYRKQMKVRLNQVNKMTEDELAEQMSAKVPALPHADEFGASTSQLPGLEQELQFQQEGKAGTSRSTTNTTK